MIDIAKIATNLHDSDGVWSPPGTPEVTFPREGNLQGRAVEDDSFWFKHRNDCIISTVRNFRPPGTILDVGGGNGYVSLGLQQSGFEVVLVEPGPDGLANARARGLSPVIHATLEDAGFREGSVPAIGSFDVLEHMENDDAFLRTVRTVLMENGRLYMTVPAYKLLWSLEDDYSRHFRRYTLGALGKKLRSTGFRVAFASYLFFFLPLPIFLLRALPSRLGIRREFSLERSKREHGARHGRLSRALIHALLAKERWLISQRKPIRFGASCLVAATPDSHV